MKKSTILWFILLVAFCAFAIRIGVALSDLLGQFQPNWFTIVPALAVFAAFVGAILRKESAATEAQSPPTPLEGERASTNSRPRWKLLPFGIQQKTFQSENPPAK
jgi:hypothetical protein